MSFCVQHSQNILITETTFKGGGKRERKMTGLSSPALTECRSELTALGTASRNLRVILDFKIFLCISGKGFLFLFCPSKCTSWCVPITNMERPVNPGNNLKPKSLLEKVYFPKLPTFKKLWQFLNRLHYIWLIKYLQYKSSIFCYNRKISNSFKLLTKETLKWECVCFSLTTSIL